MHSAPCWVLVGVAAFGFALVCGFRADASGDSQESRWIRLAGTLHLPGLALVIVGLSLAQPPALRETPQAQAARIVRPQAIRVGDMAVHRVAPSLKPNQARKGAVKRPSR